jgi:hypothetical protein
MIANVIRAVGISALSMVAGVPAHAGDAAHPVVIELFTSQGCSSCPPADQLLTDIARTRPDVLALAFHVTYWNNLGWRDPYSLDEATSRQRSYARISGQGGIYTPQAVIDGTEDAIGSDARAVDGALRRAAARASQVTLSGARGDDGIGITLGAGSGEAKILLVGYDSQHRTAIGRGENAGATLVESNIVRGLAVAGEWQGAPVTLHHAAPAGEHAAIIGREAERCPTASPASAPACSMRMARCSISARRHRVAPMFWASGPAC